MGLHRLDPTFYFFAGAFPLSSENVSCDVPLISGNRVAHAIGVSTEASCGQHGGCWDGSGDVCSLHETAQLIACSENNPTDATSCLAKGCCFDDAFSPGYCFRSSPRCFTPAPKASTLSPRPGGQWMTTPAVSDDGSIVSFAECQGLRSNCGISTYRLAGDEVLWRFPLAAFCDDENGLCMCPGTVSVEVPAPAIGAQAVYAIACTAMHMVFLGLDISEGKLLWQQPLDAYASGHQPMPLYSKEHDLVYIGFQHGSSGDAGTISARSSTTGAEVWSAEVSGHSCTGTKWWDVPAVALSGDIAIFWDDFGLRAVDARTGAARWDTRTSAYAVPLYITTPVVSGDITVVPVVKHKKNCDSTYVHSYSFAGFAVEDGSLRGVVRSPSRTEPAAVAQPIALGKYWIFTETGLDLHSTVHGIRSPVQDDVAV